MSQGAFVFVESYPQAIAGQQQTLLALLASAPVGAGQTVVVTPNDGRFTDCLRADGIEFVVWSQPTLLNRYGGAVYRDGILTRMRVFGQTAGYIGRLWRELGRLGPVVVFCNDLRGLLTVGLAARLRGLPVMIWDKLDKSHGALDWLQLPLVTRNVVISRAVTNKYPAWQRSLLRRRIRVVPNGVDAAAIEAAGDVPADFGVGGGGPVVGIVGTVTPRKGHDRVLAVWSRVLETEPSVRLVIVGEPGSEEDRQWAATLPNRDHPSVSWLGQREDVPAVMHALDVLVVPSRHEGMGRVCVEAMAAGTVVVGAHTGGIPEVVLDGDTGLLFDPDDPDDLYEKLRRVCADAALRTRLGEAGQRRALEEFEQSKQHRRIWEILDELKTA